MSKLSIGKENMIKKISNNKLSPLRYPGGKSKLGPWLSDLLKFNSLNNTTYVEPYAGGAGAALFLLMNNSVKKILINDFDIAIYSIWHSILNNTEQFISKIIDTNINIKIWEKQKEIISNPENYSLLDIGFASFFLNRTNVSGIIKGGPIGGRTQTSKYTLDVRFNKNNLIERIKNIQKHKERIQISNLDALDLLTKINDKMSESYFIYLDPPYYQKGSQLYRNYYNHEDHLKIAKKLKNINNPWVISYDNCSEIKKIYKDFDGFEFSLRYSAGQKNKIVATELMYYNNIKLHQKPNLIK